MNKVLSFAMILLATISKCVSEDSKIIINNFTKKNFVENILNTNFLKRMQKNVHQNWRKKKYVRGALPH